jgi:hypothetical protein
VRLEEETILFPMPTSPRCLRDHCRSQGLEPSPVGLILNSSAVIAAERQGALSGKSRSRHKQGRRDRHRPLLWCRGAFTGAHCLEAP